MLCTPYIAMLISFQLYWLLADNGILTNNQLLLKESLDTEYVKSINVYQLLGLIRNDRQGVTSADAEEYATRLWMFPVYRECLHYFAMVLLAYFGNLSFGEVVGKG